MGIVQYHESANDQFRMKRSMRTSGHNRTFLVFTIE